MNPDTGEIRRFADINELRGWEKKLGHPVVELTEEQAAKLEPLGARKRKGFMRNQPCVCGSGEKFKRCCWGSYA